MNHVEVVTELISIVKNIQLASGREYKELKEGSNPYLDCPGFDSLNGVEATVEIAIKVDKELPFNNVFFEDPDTLNFSQAATRVLDSTGT